MDPHKDCPKLVTVVPDERKEEQISVLLWATREDPNKGKDKDGKAKKVHGLWTHIMTIYRGLSAETLHLLQGDDDQHGLLSQHHTDHDLSNSSEVCRESCIRGGVG